MEHEEVILFIRAFFSPVRPLILPSTSISDYETFKDWEMGTIKHNEMSAIFKVLKEYTQQKNLTECELHRDQIFYSEDATLKLLALIDKHKVRKFIIQATGQEIYGNY